MLLTNTNINTLPFYSNLSEQWHKQPHSTYHHIFTPTYSLLPFQLATTNMSSSIVVTLYDRLGNSLGVLNNADIGIAAKSYTTYQVVYCTGKIKNGLFTSGNRYYIGVKVGTGITADYFYSDLFEPNEYIGDMVKIQYWNLQDIDFGDYKIFSGTTSGYFQFNHYVGTEIGKPTYPFQNYISQREMYNFPLKMISNKQYTFPLIVTEPQMDALRLLAISDKIAIVFKSNTYKVLWLEFSDIEWDDEGVGTLDATFTVNSVINRFVKAKPTRGDFNDDFNNDFL